MKFDADDGFECRNCGGQRAALRWRGLPDRLSAIDGTFDYVRCEACGLVQLHPIPSDLGRFYEGYRVHAPDSFLYDLARRGTIGHCYYRPSGRGRTVLDIGAGGGWYLQDMKRRGWNGIGFEPDPGHARALSERLGIPVHSTLDELDAYEGKVDLCTFHFSFEHLDRPLTYLDRAARWVKPGGEIYLCVPNLEGREARLFGSRWFHLDAPRHVTFFSKSHLEAGLDARGFDTVSVKNLAVPTGLAGSLSYLARGRFDTKIWYASIPAGLAFSALVRDGNFAILGRRRPP